MVIAICFGSYNKYRFHRPWIAKVIEWPSGKSSTVIWGKYQGDEEGGDVEIIADPGDVVRWGQKGPSRRQTKSCWGIVQEDGSVKECTMTQAHKAWKLMQDSKTDGASTSTAAVPGLLTQFSTDQLLSALKRRGIKP